MKWNMIIWWLSGYRRRKDVLCLVKLQKNSEERQWLTWILREKLGDKLKIKKITIKISPYKHTLEEGQLESIQRVGWRRGVGRMLDSTFACFSSFSWGLILIKFIQSMLGEVELLIMSPCNTELRAGNQRVGSMQAQSLYTSVNR